ncbi:ATPase, T2SS/T4P/T4SS family [Serratia symbiotica]|uniref:ATPase, T2SS/T4P/T4SS family n=1 Tax=Serratia symbiotica TaxID=138074 RepID=UPI0013298FCA|nr:ATPase, T2SS/T4P/T4SS family [Serratia symbiotica]QTP13319.1 Flp pilus assembly complex ATPase component TadA [Serratia symbiotica]
MTLMPQKKIANVQVSEGFVFNGRFNHKEDLKKILLESVRQNASDIMIQPRLPVIFRINGKLKALSDVAITYQDMESLCVWVSRTDAAMSLINSGSPINCRQEVHVPSEHAHEAPQRLGFRVNISSITDGGNITAQIVIRPIPQTPPLISAIDLDKSIVEAMCQKNGISIVAGETGVGKTTTFASIVRYILENNTPIKGNIIEHAEPIEYTYESIISDHSIVAQSSIPENFSTFAAANAEAMRRKPALILIGELRDESSIQGAVEASKTGHPVFATVHALDPTLVVSRLITRFPIQQHSAAINDICAALRVIVAQTLVPSVSGKLIAVRSWIIFTKEHRKQLSLLNRIEDVTRVMSELMESDGHTYSDEADRLLGEGLIDEETALSIRRL